MEEQVHAGAAPAEAERERISREVREFVAEFPEVKPEELGEDVWTAVREGRSLTAAYRDTRARQLAAENRRLKERLEAEDRNGRNRAASLGSQASQGGTAVRDAFLAGLLED